MARETEEKKTQEDMSLEECSTQIEEDRRKAGRAFFLAGVALITIVALAIAWFVSNHTVNGSSSAVAAQSDEPFQLASVGERQTKEKNHLKDAEDNNILSDGATTTYESYIDTNTWKAVKSDQTYYVGTSGLAWHLQDPEMTVSPGAGDKLEFYVIPKKEGLTTVTVTMSLTGYTLNESETTQKAEKVEDATLQRLIDGHILLFHNLDDKHGYSGWLGTTNTLTLTAPDGGTFQKDTPYKVTLYWKWPRYFRNYVYTQRSTQGDLFTTEVNETEYTNWIDTFVNAEYQKEASTSRLFYDAEGKALTGIDKISNSMSDSVLNACNTYYNQADEYIGTNANFIYMEINVSQ